MKVGDISLNVMLIECRQGKPYDPGAFTVVRLPEQLITLSFLHIIFHSTTLEVKAITYNAILLNSTIAVLHNSLYIEFINNLDVCKCLNKPIF